MVLDDATHAAHEEYISHTMRCTLCHPPTKRYCFDGLAFFDRYQAQYLMSLDLYERRAFLAKLEPIDPARCDAIKALLLEIHERNQLDLC